MDKFDIDIGSTALVLIDLQNSNVRRDLAPYTAEQVLGNCVVLAGEMRDRGAMIIYVRVLLGEMLAQPADAPLGKAGAPAPPPDATYMADAAQVQATDLVVSKRQWGAFYGTELDQLLRRRHIKTIVLGGIATNFGVESTAREAFDRGYRLVFAEDAMSSFDAELHRFACGQVFPKMGRVRSTAHLVDLLQAGSGDA